MSLHVRMRIEVGHYLPALYDKINRADILAHLHAQHRSSSGAAGAVGRKFTDVEVHQVQWQLDELPTPSEISPDVGVISKFGPS